MKNENLIHVKLEYEEALQSKKDILSSEMNLIRIIRIIRQYRLLRLKELKTKSKLHQKIKDITANIKKMQTILPKIKIPKILKKEKTAKEPEKLQIEEKPYDKDLEKQLRDIQDKLKSINKY